MQESSCTPGQSIEQGPKEVKVNRTALKSGGIRGMRAALEHFKCEMLYIQICSDAQRGGASGVEQTAESRA